MRIRILFFIEDLRAGGAEKVLRDLVNHMDQRQFDITVGTVWPYDASQFLAPGIHYKSLYPAENAFYHKLYRAEAAGGLAYRLHLRGDYDIECAYLETGPTKIMAASTNKKAVKLAWVHCDLQRAMSDPQAFAEKTASQYAKFDQIVCVSRSVKESFDALFGNRFHTTVVYNVVDDAAIRRKSAEPLTKGLSRRKFTVLSVGRFSPPKKFLRLLQAHKRLLDEGVEHDLWILGEGPERTLLEAYIRENGLQDSVSLPGFVENPYPFLREADLLACSSIYEGYSTFLTEGVILGKPIVTTLVSGAEELLGDSDYGLVTENDDEAFYVGLKRLVLDPALRHAYAEKALQRGKAFSTAEIVAKTEQFFLNALEG